MNRHLFNVMMAQYATPEVLDDGLVSWEDGKKCVIPSVKLYGAAVQDGTPTPDAPVMPVCNNGVFAARGRNLTEYKMLPKSGYWLDGSGGLRSPNAGFICLSITVMPNKLYTISSNLEIYTIWSTDQSDTPVARTEINANTTAYITPHDCVSLRISLRNTSGVADTSAFEWLQCELGDTVTPCTPYYDGGQVQAPELWAIPGTEFRDEWDCQTGRGIRRIKQVVLTGQEVLISNSETISLPLTALAQGDTTLNCMCTHLRQYDWNTLYDERASSDAQGCAVASNCIQFVNNPDHWDVDAACAYMAAQYAAGTPVTIWYALAIPEPFYSAPARLIQPRGYGQIIQIGGAVPNCPIFAKYLTQN